MPVLFETEFTKELTIDDFILCGLIGGSSSFSSGALDLARTINKMEPPIIEKRFSPNIRWLVGNNCWRLSVYPAETFKGMPGDSLDDRRESVMELEAWMSVQREKRAKEVPVFKPKGLLEWGD